MEQWESQGEEGLLIWDSSVWEKPESLKSEGLGPVQSSKAKRLTHVKPGYYTPPGKPICVPGLHWIGLLLVGMSLTQGPAMLAAVCWWTARGWRSSWSRDEDKKLLERASRSWGRQVLHVFDRGYASSVWLGALQHYGARFVLRWRHQYRLLFDGKLKVAWKIAQGKKAWGSRGLWDARRRQWISASVLAFPVRHPDHPDLPLWLVVARRKGSTPWYLLTSEPVETEADAWKVVMAYARRWQIEVMWKTCKSELGMQSPRVWDWESRLKLLGLARLSYAFLLHLLSAPFRLLRRWLFRYAAHRTGRRGPRDAGAAGALATGPEPFVAGLSASLQSTRQTSGCRELTSVRCASRPAVSLPEQIQAGGSLLAFAFVAERVEVEKTRNKRRSCQRDQTVGASLTGRKRLRREERLSLSSRFC